MFVCVYIYIYIERERYTCTITYTLLNMLEALLKAACRDRDVLLLKNNRLQ